MAIATIFAAMQTGDLDLAEDTVRGELLSAPEGQAKAMLLQIKEQIIVARSAHLPSHALTAPQLFPADTSAEAALKVLKQHELFRTAADQEVCLDKEALIWLLRNLRQELVDRQWMGRNEDERVLATRLMQVADIHSPPRGYLDERAFKFLWSNLRYIAHSRPPETHMVKCQFTFQLGTREEWSKGLGHLLGRHLRRSIETEVRHDSDELARLRSLRPACVHFACCLA